MSRELLTGSRVRERRHNLGISQTALAQTVGISPSYLNLIEHNRRRIGGKLLLALAEALGVEASNLTEGAEAAMLAGLQNAAGAEPGIAVEDDRIEEFAGRFSGWATLLAARQRRVEELEHIVEALNDRLTHDPQLAASVHEVLSVVTSIRSASAILAGGDVVDKDWQARFHRNLYEDSRRLSGSAQALVEYLDAAAEEAEGAGPALPLDRLELWLSRRGFHVAELEGAQPVDPQVLVDGDEEIGGSPPDRGFALRYLRGYRADAVALPMERLLSFLAEGVSDPAEIAARANCDLSTVLRRLACRPPGTGGDNVGLVTCDSSGTITFRRPLDGFSIPRFGSCCALWPLFQALGAPMQPVRANVEQDGHVPLWFETYSVARPVAAPAFDRPRVMQATMLILPGQADNLGMSFGIGPGCRICTRQDCVARREPSIMTEGF